MKIRALHVENFRGFEKLDVTFHPSMTVLIGENAAGKTALLEAVCLALGKLFLYIGGETRRAARPFRRTDVRHRIFEHAGALVAQPQRTVRVAADGIFDGEPAVWVRAQSEGYGHGPWHQSRTLRRAVKKLISAVDAGEPCDLPVVTYYGTQRLWLHKKITEAKRGIGSRYDGYVDALDPASNHRQLAEWMYQQTLVELQTGKPVLQLRAIEHAVCQCVEATKRFFFDVRSQELIIEQDDGEHVPFSFLSDGYRNMIALIADIAWRCVVLNPQHADHAAERSEGVVLIDEIDLHLHPRWQRRVLADLRRTFPCLQFIVTTHSPQVIASARRDEVRLFDRNALVPLQPFVEGRDSNSLLEDVFGVSGRPEEAQREIEAIGRLLDEERYEEARKMLDAAEERLGPDDPAVLRSRWILAREAPETI